jgi:hypothetical protein
MHNHFRDWHRRHHSGGKLSQHHHMLSYWLQIGDLAILLDRNCKDIFVMSQLHKKEKVTLSIIARDVAGVPVQFAPDSKPVWTNSNPAAATDAVAADGLSDVLTPAPAANIGDVTSVGLTVVIKGIAFTATVDETIVDGDVASIEIVETFSPNP